MTLEPEDTGPETGAEGTAAPEATVESLAREMGWKPDTEWKGAQPEGGLLSAADYLKAQKAKADTFKKQLSSFEKDTAKRIAKLEEKSKREREREVTALHKEYDHWIKQAARNGDDDQYERLLAEKAELEGADEDEADEGPSEEQWIENFKPSYPELQKRFWGDSGHAWALEDDADPDAVRLVLEFVDSGAPIAEALEKADAALRRAYPDRYEDDEDDEPPPKRTSPRVPVLAPGGRRAGGPSASSRLTAAQREIGARFVKEGVFASLEEYAEERLKDPR